MAVNDTKLTIKTFSVDLGFRAVASDSTRDIVPYHEIRLTGIGDGPEAPITITIELWADLRHLAPTELGFYDVSRHTITIKAPISEFDRAYRLLHQVQPVYFVFNQLEVAGSRHPEIKSISSAGLVTDSQPVSRGDGRR
jgi:hypothetical protein